MSVKDTIEKAIDVRQFPQWGKFLKNIGWNIEKVDGNNIAIRKIPFIKRSIIKIQHPIYPFSLKKIDLIAKKYKTLFVLIEPHNYRYDEKEFILHGYRKSNMHVVHSSTIRISLEKSEKDIFKSFSENAKRNIKKAKKNNLVIRIFKLNEKDVKKHFEVFYKLLSSLVKIKKFYIPQKKETYAKMNAFKNNSVFVFAYEKKNVEDPIACLWLGYYKNISVYLQTGITKRGYELLANYVLVWKALQFSKKNKIKIFDFESIYDKRYKNEHKDWIGYSEFKKRFHGEIIEYPQNWIKIYNPLMHIFRL